MSGQIGDPDKGAGKGRRTRPWAQTRGSSSEADELAGLLREWLDDAGLRLDDLVGKLTPDHFNSKVVPGRSTVAGRLAGVNLQWDFVEAVADVCSRDLVERKRRTDRARPLFDAAERAKRSGTEPRGAKRSRTGAGATGESRAAAVTAELVGVQRQSLELSDQLLRALERAAELEKARNDANQMVLILLALVDKLHRDIATLTAQRDRAPARPAAQDALDEVRKRLHHSEAQRTHAETELVRARAEREKADRLAEQSAEQVRRLTEELARLRGTHEGLSAETDELPEADPPVPAPASAPLAPDDIDVALMKASRILDVGAERLEQLAEELQDEPDGLSSPDNPVTGDDVPHPGVDNSADSAPYDRADPVDNSPDNSVADSRGEYVHDPLVGEILDAVKERRPIPRTVSRVLAQGTEPSRFLTALESLRAMNAPVAAAHILVEAGTGRPAHTLVDVLSRLSSDDARVVVSAIGATRATGPFLDVVAALRAAGLSHLTNQALLEAGRLRDIERLPLLLSPVRVGSADTVVILKGACSRPLSDVGGVVRHLAAAGMRQEAAFVRVASALTGGTDADGDPLGRWGHMRWFEHPRRGLSAPPAATPSTLTTRIRINIPGTRPIPPIVVRKPVLEEEA
ncbi:MULTISPECIES: hypothetical protein [unclassified Streptomyces]|uniref:hypothetical protein n=1 Tax=unclassified Streptomyces TaxID=2593676 RepID=UPI002365C946|nr:MULTISPECIES: hypothetical protein [unclassified Streptomyces]MDF3149202.1 hypothetical protein [Streptomyces sp. T21Q-yed]WDF40403.1 hypothetical protein PBV52_28285 [Streptomyces sp. T12]